MNRPFKRLLALAGSATVGVLAAVAIATPAHAHHVNTSGWADCLATGKYQITWKIEHPENWSDRYAKIETLTVVPNTTITAVAPATTFAVGTKIDPKTTLTGTQLVDGTVTSATLIVKTRWYESNGTSTNITDVDTVELGSANGLKGKCTPESSPTAAFVSLCNGTVKVHIINAGRSEATFKVTAGAWEQSKTLASGAEADVVVPADKAGTKITVTKGDTTIGETPGWSRPENCPTPKAEGDSTCTTFTVTVTNPQDGVATEATVTYGTQVQKVALAAGQSKVVELSPGNVAEAKVEFAGWNGTQSVKYNKPADCPGLPVTGTNTTTYVATGIGLAAIGFFAIYFGRRRLARLRRMAA